MELVERDTLLQQLEALLGAVARGSGHTAFVAGEAGIGKTSLLKALAAATRRCRVVVGRLRRAADAAPLAPLHDIARTASVALPRAARARGDRGALFDAVLDRAAAQPQTGVARDRGRALGRRRHARPDQVPRPAHRSRACPAGRLTYRDDELSPAHPLRRLLGELPASLITRIDLQRLSPQAVDLLARRALRSRQRHARADAGQPVLRDRAAARRRRCRAAQRARPGAGALRAPRRRRAGDRAARLRWCRRASSAGWSSACSAPTSTTLEAVPELRAADAAGRGARLSPRAGARGDRIVAAPNRWRSRCTPRCCDALDHDPSPGALPAWCTTPRAPATTPRCCATRRRRRARRSNAARTAKRRRIGAPRSRTHDAAVDDSERAAWLDAYARECQSIDQLDEAIAARLALARVARPRAAHAAGGRQPEPARAGVRARRCATTMPTRRAGARSRCSNRCRPAPQLASAYRVEAHLRMLNRDHELAIALGRHRRSRWPSASSERDALAAANSARRRHDVRRLRRRLRAAAARAGHRAGRRASLHRRQRATTTSAPRLGRVVPPARGRGAPEAGHRLRATRTRSTSIAATAWPGCALCEMLPAAAGTTHWRPRTTACCTTDAPQHRARDGAGGARPAARAARRPRRRRGARRSTRARAGQRHAAARGSGRVPRAPRRRSCAATGRPAPAKRAPPGAARDRQRHPWFAGELAFWLHAPVRPRRRSRAAAPSRTRCSSTAAGARLPPPGPHSAALTSRRARSPTATQRRSSTHWHCSSSSARGRRPTRCATSMRAAGVRGLPRGAARVDADQPAPTHRARARGAATVVRGLEELRDRRAPVPLGAHGRPPRGGGVRQARRRPRAPRRGGRAAEPASLPPRSENRQFARRNLGKPTAARAGAATPNVLSTPTAGRSQPRSFTCPAT